MAKHFGIINMISLIFFAALLVAYLHYVDKERNEIEQLKLSYSIDLAADAAVDTMLHHTGRLDMDYTRPGSITVDPEMALETFLEVFCFNYNLHPTESNKALVKNFITVAAVAAFDGYYIASERRVRNGAGDFPEYAAGDGDWELAFSMKMPYAYEHGGVLYALNMGMRDTIALSTSELYRIDGLPPTDTGTLTHEEARSLINDTISNHMAYVINELNENNPNWRHNFYIPSQLTTFTGVNPITGPSFIVLVQNVNLSTARPISGFSVSGSSISEVRWIAGYERGGTKYYAYADQLSESITIENIYRSMEEAAKAGYHADMTLLK